MTIYYYKILALQTYHQSETDGDELFLKYGKKRIWPENNRYIKINEPRTKIDQTIPLKSLGEKVQLELWEYDSFLSSDLLGTFSLLTDQAGGPFSTDLTLRGNSYARYSLSWELISKNV